MLEIFFSMLLTAIVALVTWFGTHFVGNPFIKFYSLREKIHQSLFFTANTGARDDDPARYDKAVEELRRHAAALDALRVTLPSFPKWVLNKRGYKLEEVVSGITSLSNTLDVAGEKAIYRNKIECGLKFPRNYTDIGINEIKAALNERATNHRTG